MASRLALAVVGAFSISLLVVGAGRAAVCDPHCSPQSNKPSQSTNGPEVRGTDHAINVANPNAEKGLDTARSKPGNYKTPVSPTGGDTGGGDTGGGSTGGGDTGGGGDPCSGC
jgi:hypothetical protein